MLLHSEPQVPFPDDSIANEAGVIKTGVSNQSSELGAINHRAQLHRLLHELFVIAAGRGNTEMRSSVTRGGGWKEKMGGNEARK